MSSVDDAGWRDALLSHASSKRRRRTGPLDDERSALAEDVLIAWGYNKLSALQVQWLCTREQIDLRRVGGRSIPLVDKLASLGGHGLHKGNIRRDLIELVRSLIQTMKPSIQKLPLLITKGPKKGAHEIESGFIRPHLWMSVLYTHYRNEFDRTIRGPQDNLAKFWESLRPNDPRRTALKDILKRPNLKSKAIPIWIYGDGVPCCKNQSFVATAWESLTANYETGTHSSNCIHYVGGYYSHTEVVKPSPPSNDTTCQRFMKILIRSLKLAESGKSESGAFLAGGYYLVVIGTKCDYDHLVNHWQMPGHWQHAHPCAWCPCDRSSTSMGFRNTKPDAAWRPLSFSVSGNDAWQAHCRLVKKSPCPLFCRHAVLKR